MSEYSVGETARTGGYLNGHVYSPPIRAGGGPTKRVEVRGGIIFG